MMELKNMENGGLSVGTMARVFIEHGSQLLKYKLPTNTKILFL
jgi:hypothetical protein